MSRVHWWCRRRWDLGLRPPFIQPAISSLVPSLYLDGSPTPITIQIAGNDFHPTRAAVTFNAAATTPVSTSRTLYTISVSNTGGVGRIVQTVLTNPDGKSASRGFEIVRQVIAGLNPNNGLSGNPALTVAVNGGGFTPTSQAYIMEAVLPTTYVSAAVLNFTIDLTGAAPSAYSVTVRDRGTVSNPIQFFVN